MKKILVILQLVFLTSCVAYGTSSKIDKSFDVNEAVANSQGLLKKDYYTAENIIKVFGTPIEEKKVDGNTTLFYKASTKQTYTSILFFILPVKFENDSNILDYSFEFENNRLNKINYQDIVTKTYAAGLMFPPYMSRQQESGLIPWKVYGCSKEHSKVFSIIPHMKQGKYKESVYCYNDKLFSIDVNEIMLFDRSKVKNGYTKMFNMASIIYDKNVVNFDKKNIESALESYFFTQETGRLTDIQKSTENMKTKVVDCKIFKDKAKDPKANNKGNNSYLIFEGAGAICYIKNSDIIVTMSNSNRYPESMQNEIDTLGELKAVISSIEMK